MAERKIPVDLECGINIYVHIMSGKWKPCILNCINNNFHRPSEIHKEITAAVPRVLNMQIKELTDHGLLCKKIYAQTPLKVEYYLTDLGRSIIPLINAMDKWGTESLAFTAST